MGRKTYLIQDWALETKGWRMVIFEKDKKPRLSEEEYDLTQLNPNEYADKLFCRERWIKTTLSKTGEELPQRLIVTFSFKYREYLRRIREKQVARATKIIERGEAGKLGKVTKFKSSKALIRRLRGAGR